MQADEPVSRNAFDAMIWFLACRNRVVFNVFGLVDMGINWAKAGEPFVEKVGGERKMGNLAY